MWFVQKTGLGLRTLQFLFLNVLIDSCTPTAEVRHFSVCCWSPNIYLGDRDFQSGPTQTPQTSAFLQVVLVVNTARYTLKGAFDTHPGQD